MQEYLNYIFEDTVESISTFDELPLWSAPFGLLLLKHIILNPNMTVVDIGSGAGFPLTEIAARLDNSCKVYGIDPWKNANNRAKQKIQNYKLQNIEILEQSAEIIPLDNSTIDLVTSNLGINNFENPTIVFKECHRVLKDSGNLTLTTNLMGHWAEFYQIFYETLSQLKREKLIDIIKQDEEHRGTVESISTLFTDNGFHVKRYFEDKFEMRFLNGTAFLNHHFIKLGWLSTWIDILPKNELAEIFKLLEQNLNAYAHKQGELKLSVPMLYIEGEKK